MHRACKEALQPLIRFDRPLRDCSKESLITSSTELSNKFLEGKNVLFAIGSRHLHEAVVSARKAGANTFARVLPTPESLRQALASGIPGIQIAVMHPFKGEPKGQIEQELCRSWLIDCVVCRESGGITQELWQEISNKNGIDIFMISRPELFKDLEVVHTLKALIDRVGIS